MQDLMQEIRKVIEEIKKACEEPSSRCCNCANYNGDYCIIYELERKLNKF